MAEAQPVNLIFGQLGHLMVMLAWVSAALAAWAFWRAGRQEERSWLRLGRAAFAVHSAAVLGIVGTLFAMIFGHHFEYHYVWQHSSRDLPLKYILSCFWEGQEGSFLLWSFWHAVLGMGLILAGSRYQGRLLSVISGVQVFLISFLAGIYVLGVKVGTSPFLLLEDVMASDPVFLFDDYMRFIQDGTGLNALLQNYWMVIHPPVLFLGFASTIVPFAFAWSSLRFGEYRQWIAPSTPWTFFAVLVLGAGILMGGRWAYESLSFGGFWAWDPVENASLVPWLVLVGGAHAMVSFKATGRALRSAFSLVILAYFFILLSTFLTRSGVLGDTSVHSFVSAGLTNHLLIMLGAMVLSSAYLLFRHWGRIPAKATEEPVSSREFWMFLGALVLTFAALQIIVVTSIPAFNAFFSWVNSWSGLGLPQSIPTPANPEAYYNSIQIWVAIGVGILMGLGQLFRYRKTHMPSLRQTLLLTALLSLVVAALSAWTAGFPFWVEARLRGSSGSGISMPNSELLLLWSAWFAVIANAWYLLAGLKGKLSLSAASLAHAGFGIMLVGILISGSRQQVISHNQLGIDYGENFDRQFKRENILLYEGMPQSMGPYQVTYLGDSLAGEATYYAIRYEVQDEQGGVQESFVLQPYLLRDKKTQQLSPNPATRHYMTRDVFTHVSAVPNQEAPREEGPKIQSHTVRAGDTIFFGAGTIVVDAAVSLPPLSDTLRAGLRVLVSSSAGETEAIPELRIAGSRLLSPPLAVPGVPLQLLFRSVNPEKGEFELATVEPRSANDWVILKAIIFPQIRLVWIGSIILFAGILISVLRRWSLIRRTRTEVQTPV